MVLRGLEQAAKQAEQYAATFTGEAKTFHIELSNAFRAAAKRLNEVATVVASGDVPPGYVPDDKITSGDLLDFASGLARAVGIELPPRRR